MFQWSLSGCQGCLKEVKCFRKSFKGFTRIVQRSFKGISRKIAGLFLDTFEGDSRELQRYLKEVQRVFQEIFKGVSKMF